MVPSCCCGGGGLDGAENAAVVVSGDLFRAAHIISLVACFNYFTIKLIALHNVYKVFTNAMSDEL